MIEEDKLNEGKDTSVPETPKSNDLSVKSGSDLSTEVDVMHIMFPAL
jgi:hypothetical protein